MFNSNAKKKEFLDQHHMICAIYTKNLQFKKEYFNEISRVLIQNKLEFAEMKSRDASRRCKKVKFTDFINSDLLGIQKVEISAVQSSEKPETFLFPGLTSEFFTKFLVLVSRNQTFTINVRLHRLLNRDELPELNTQRQPRLFSLPQQPDSPMVQHSDINSIKLHTDLMTDNSSISSSENVSSHAEKKYKKILSAKYKKKKLKRKIREKLRKYSLPGKLRETVYEHFIRDNNKIDREFVISLSNTEKCLPKNIALLMQANLAATMAFFSQNDEFLAFEIFDTLKLFYYYRPDIGYKAGMETYVLVLAISCRKDKLRKVFFSLVLDYLLLFGVFKCTDQLSVDFKSELIKRLEIRLSAKIANKDFVWHFFLHVVSNCFSRFFSLENLVFF